MPRRPPAPAGRAVERRRRLSPAALAVTNQKVHRAYSPIVIAGAVRVIDFVLLSLIGVALYLWYVMPLAGFHWEYVAAIIGMTFAAVVCFQAADIYQVQVFRGQLRQMTRMISSWTFVFLLFIGVSFSLKLGNEVSRLWLSSFFFVGLAALDRRAPGAARAGAQLGASGPARPPHHHRRRRRERRAVGRGAQRAGSTPTSTCSACSTTATMIARWIPAPAAQSSARSTTSSSSPAAPASTSCCSRCRSRRRRAFSKC